MNKLLVLPNHAEQFHLMKLNFMLHGVSLRFYQLKIMKVVTTPDLDKVAKKVF